MCGQHEDDAYDRRRAQLAICFSFSCLACLRERRIGWMRWRRRCIRCTRIAGNIRNTASCTDADTYAVPGTDAQSAPRACSHPGT